MASRQEHISIRRQSNSERPQTEDQQPSGGQQRPTRVTKADKDSLRRTKIAAILMMVVAVMILIALLTYTSRDEANAQLSMHDILAVIRGDDALRVRFDTTYNWLGLIGAVIAQWLYISTIGIWSMAIPLLMLMWGRDVFRFQKLTPQTTRFSIVTLSLALVLASFVGSLQQWSWMQGIDRMFIGAIGQFTSSIFVRFVGVFGSVLLHLVALAFVVVFGYRINVTRLAVFSKLQGNGLVASISRYLSRQPRGEDVIDHAEDSATGQQGSVGESAVPVTPSHTPPPVKDSIVRPFLSSRPVVASEDSILPLPPGTPERPPVVDRAPLTKDESPIDLAPGVRILRSTRGRSPEPNDGTGNQQHRSAPQSPLDSTVNDDNAAISQQPDYDVLQERLKALHPQRDISIKRDAGPSDPGDPPELPLFLQDDDDVEEVELPPVLQSRRADIVRPLTVNVEENVEPEPEIAIPNATLYDEHIVYKTPSGSLLVDSKEDAGITDDELQENARLLQEKLETFRIKIENLTVQPGPVVTQYEFVPAAGIKLSQIESLSDDIALALKAQGVRIIAPIPGRGTVGIEIPNHNPAVVRFSTIVKSPKYHNPDIKLPIAMGKTVVGEVYCADLTKMPHLLIAGATGKGKSVGINTIIASLIYRLHPRDLKFVIIDPKRVEMTLYAALKNHFLAMCPDVPETIITEPANAVTVLKSVVEEMQQRYTILAAAGQRNIADYNRKAKEGSLKNKGGIEHRPMPYIVVIIDELADLMMTAGKEVEDPIVRLAQLARAVGIHCIVATQRPSVDVVTGLIKANFPARIAYQVASRIDSRTILDASGAEHLIGNGDMLFNPGSLTKPLRMQNAFISTEEVEAVCEWIGKQKGYSAPYALPSVSTKRPGAGGGSSDDRDVLFEDAARTFIQLQQASVSTLQRRLKVGYARAARIVDELEMAGIVGPPDGSKGRQVLLQSESELEAYL